MLTSQVMVESSSPFCCHRQKIGLGETEYFEKIGFAVNNWNWNKCQQWSASPQLTCTFQGLAADTEISYALSIFLDMRK